MSDKPSYRIIAAKHLSKLCSRANNKEEIVKMMDIVFNDTEDLPKLLSIEVLLQLYSVNANSVLSKIKALVCIGTWRVNIRLCEFSEEFTKVLSKNHYKLLL